MSNNIVLETKQNKEGVFEVIKDSSIIQKAKEAWAKIKEFIVEAVNKVKAKMEDIKSNFEDIKSNPIYQGIKDGAKSFFKNTAIGTAVVTAWGVVMPGFISATIAAALTISAVKEIKAVIKAEIENKHYEFNAVNFISETFIAWCYAIVGVQTVIFTIPLLFKLAMNIWAYSLVFLLA